MTSGIYAIINMVNGKRYIGSSQNIEKRIIEHRGLLRKNTHHSRYLQSAWNKYGEINFEFSVLEDCSVELLLVREQAYINLGCEYNIAKFADASQRGLPVSIETRQKRSAALKGRVSPTKGRKRPVSERNKISNALSKRVWRDESREKISASKRGKKRPAEMVQRMSEIMLGKKHSSETRQKIAEIHRNRSPEDEAARLKKISDTKRNYSSERKAEVSQRMSEAGRNRTLEERAEISRKRAATRLARTAEQKSENARRLSNAYHRLSPERKAERSRKIAEGIRKFWEEKRKLRGQK